MNYLEQLKKLISDSFEAKEVKSKTDIDNYAEMTKICDNAMNENNKLLEANAELSKQYTELAMHTTIGNKPNEKDVNITKEVPTLESMISQFESK